MNEVQTCEEANGGGQRLRDVSRTQWTGVRFAQEYVLTAFWTVLLQQTPGNKWWTRGCWLLFLLLLFCTVLVFIYRL